MTLNLYTHVHTYMHAHYGTTAAGMHADHTHKQMQKQIHIYIKGSSFTWDLVTKKIPQDIFC